MQISKTRRSLPQSKNIDFNLPFHVGAKSALLRRLFIPMAKKTSSARFLAPPFQITTAVLGCDLVLGANLKPGYLYGCDSPGYIQVSRTSGKSLEIPDLPPLRSGTVPVCSRTSPFPTSKKITLECRRRECDEESIGSAYLSCASGNPINMVCKAHSDICRCGLCYPRLPVQ